MMNNLIITIFGSCRQDSIKNHFTTTSIKERLTYPHYTKEIIQAMEYCKGINNIEENLTRYCFRTGILTKSNIKNYNELKDQYNKTDLFVVEITSRISYEWNNLYVHHILTENEYGFEERQNIKIKNLSDEEIEEDIKKIVELAYPKKILIIPHIYTYTSGKRYELVKLLEKITSKYKIPFLNPTELINNNDNIFEKDNCHYTIKGHEIVGNLYKDKINNIMKKTVIIVWKGSYSNMPRNQHGCFWGIGDMLRGVIGIFKLSKKYNFNLIVDKKYHTLNGLLEQEEHEYSDLLKENIDSVPLIMPEDVEKYILLNLLNKKENNHLFLYSNMPLSAYNGETSIELKNFISTILKPTDYFKQYLEEKKKEINLINYSIIHYRFGDDQLIRGKKNNYTNAYNNLLENYNENDILITDSSDFKEFIKNKDNKIKILNTKICHLGYNENLENLRDTLLEFFLLINANSIKSFTIYGWISGFVHVINNIFGVRLDAKINCKF